MSNLEIVVNNPYARWLKPADQTLQVQRGDPLPFLGGNKDGSMVFASVNDGLREFFSATAEGIDWRYGDVHFHDMVDDALYLNTLLDCAILQVEPHWDSQLLKQFHTPALEKQDLAFVGFGCGGSFRAAISRPDNYAAVANLHQKIYGDMPDMMDIDRKLPIDEPFEQFLEDRLLPVFINMASGNTFEQLPVGSEEQDVVFKGIIGVSIDRVPERMVIIRHVRYAHITALEIRLKSLGSQDPPYPDFTIHLTKYERDLRVGPQMPASMNTLIPLYEYLNAEDDLSELSNIGTIRTQQWMALEKLDFDTLRQIFAHPEVIEKPEYQTIEEALHAGLRAIAEKMQHLNKYKDTFVPFEELLVGDWWIKYRKELRRLLRSGKTESTIFGRENRFLTSEILRLYERLNDYDSASFLQMAFPMGIMDALEPGLRKILHAYGYMLAGPNFSFSNSKLVDGAITMYVLQFPTWRARLEHELYSIDVPEKLGSQKQSTLLERYRKNQHMRICGPLRDLRRWIYFPGPYKI